MKAQFQPRLLVLAAAVSALSLPEPCLAQTANTVYLNYSFYAPPGRYLIELFEVGAPNPSRQDWALSGWYDGRFTYRRDWSYISKGRTYFLRVTNLQNGIRKQTGSFRVPASWGPYFNSPHMNWNSM